MASSAPPAAALAITSILLPHVRMLRQHGYQHSLFSRPLRLPLRAYFNGEGECPHIAGVTYVDLDKAQPWAGRFVQQHLQRTSWIQRAYARGRYRCTVAWEYQKSRVCKDVATVYKVAAIRDAVASRLARHVVWLDVDTFFQRALDERFWSFVRQFDVVTIGRKALVDRKGVVVGGGAPDTGVVMFDTARNATQQFCACWEAGYTDQAIQSAAGGVNDITLFRHCAQDGSAPGLRLAHFAVACRDEDSKEAWVVDSIHYSSKCRYCPLEMANVSPFNLFEYITHVKGRQGPIVFHNATQRSIASASRKIEGMRKRASTALPRRMGGLRQHASAEHRVLSSERNASAMLHSSGTAMYC
ncbi:hypothetical protein AB1Y20_005920 [Prymnesium parvum]|uniref:Nucleotide-diphospho-sugar transferase domain-containing protein n=1 Tax=Prymnesium parvum TaxID=97485 RepID=A0AB34J0T4_PRYPA